MHRLSFKADVTRGHGRIVLGPFVAAWASESVHATCMRPIDNTPEACRWGGCPQQSTSYGACQTPCLEVATPRWKAQRQLRAGVPPEHEALEHGLAMRHASIVTRFKAAWARPQCMLV